ncbi:MAG: peptidylprolyl isomerase [Cyanobacteriota bacterium]|jgi:cyclophilin family peptidyl-prolyl cis-trans isomerase
MANNLPDPIITQPINNVTVGVNAADTALNLSHYFDDPLTTGKVARFNLAPVNLDPNTIGTIGNGIINIVLFDQTNRGAPLTVQNFQNYVSSNRYVNSFIHRSVPNFIIQGGGYTYNNDVLGTVPSNAPVQNEYSAGRSNTRGTIAMAKLGNDPNSATNQWFFNLGNNSANLDNQNGGFTVFGQARSASDLATIDAIAAVPVYNAGGAFTNLPLTQNFISDRNLIRFSSIVVSQEAELSFAIVGNTRPALVTPKITNNQLTLDYLPNQVGSANITVRATNLFGEAIDHTFTAQVLPTLTLSANQTIVEGFSNPQTVAYTVSLSNASNQAITVSYSTTNGTAQGGLDYTPVNGTLTFNPGNTSQIINVPILNDSLNESNETFNLTLSNFVNALPGAKVVATTTLTDTLNSGVTTTLPTNVENLTLTGTNAINGTGNSLNNRILGNSANNRLNGAGGSDNLTGGTGADTFIFRFGESTVTALDRITDFAIGTDKIDLLTQGGAATGAPAGFTRAADNATTNINTIVGNVFADSNGAQAGNQALGLNRAALVKANTATYLIVNDGIAGFQSANDLVINLTGITGTLPALGTIPVANFFV